MGELSLDRQRGNGMQEGTKEEGTNVDGSGGCEVRRSGYWCCSIYSNAIAKSST
jgi:hypothetical protein